MTDMDIFDQWNERPETAYGQNDRIHQREEEEEGSIQHEPNNPNLSSSPINSEDEMEAELEAKLFRLDSTIDRELAKNKSHWEHIAPPSHHKAQTTKSQPTTVVKEAVTKT